MEFCDGALDKYNVKEDAETVLREMDEKIEENKLYIAEYEYYINDKKDSIYKYEKSEKEKEYKNILDNLSKQEIDRKLEEEFQDRKVELAEKADKRIERRRLRELSI